MYHLCLSRWTVGTQWTYRQQSFSANPLDNGASSLQGKSRYGSILSDQRVKTSRSTLLRQTSIHPHPSPQTYSQPPYFRRFGIELEQQAIDMDRLKTVVVEQVQGKDVTVFCEDERQLSHAIIDPQHRIWCLLYDGNNTEVTSPILHTCEDVALVQHVAAAISQAGGQPNVDSGLHVHIDAADLEPLQVAKLVEMLAKNQHWIYPLLGISPVRRLHYCKPILEQELTHDALPLDEIEIKLSQWGHTRYRGLNIQNFCFKERSKYTLEFRYFNGTLDAAFIAFAVGFSMSAVGWITTKPPGPLSIGPTTLPGMMHQFQDIVCGPVPNWSMGWEQHLQHVFEQSHMAWHTCHGSEQPILLSPGTLLWQDQILLDELCQCLRVDATPNQVAKLYAFLQAIAPSARRSMMEQLQTIRPRPCTQDELFELLEYLACLQQNLCQSSITQQCQILQALAPLTNQPADAGLLQSCQAMPWEKLNTAAQLLHTLPIAPLPAHDLPDWLELAQTYGHQPIIWQGISYYCHYWQFFPNRAIALQALLPYKKRPEALFHLCSNFCLLHHLLPHPIPLTDLVNIMDVTTKPCTLAEILHHAQAIAREPRRVSPDPYPISSEGPI